MKRLKIIGLILAGLVVAGLVAIALIFDLVRPSDEPSWHGKKLTEWLDQVCKTNVIDLSGEGARAIYEIGTNGFPTLFKMVEARDGAFKAKLIGMINGQQLIHVHIKSASDKQMAAMAAFMCLDANALPAVPQLLKLTQATNAPNKRTDSVGTSAMHCLLAMKEIDVDRALLRTLAKCLYSSDVQVKRGAAQFLHKFFPQDAARLGVYEIFPDLKPPGTNRPAINVPGAEK